MKAAQMTAYGDPSVMVINDVERPIAGEGQVVVDVQAASINPWDFKVRQGMAKGFMPLELPATAGGDLAGIVSSAGPGVDTEVLSVGDKVYGSAGLMAGSGAFAEFAAAPVTQLAKMPSNLDFTQAAAIGLTGVSALQALAQHIGLKSGQKILIQGGTGGIGTMAIQIAKHLGAYVATTVAAEAKDFAKGLGADEVIDYKTQKFEEIIRDYDAVFDASGSDVFEKSLDVLKPGGVAVSMTAQADEAHAKERGVKAIMQSTEATTELLDQLRELVEAGVVKAYVDKTFSLDDIQEAFRVLESGGVKGKVVLTI